MCVPEYVYLPHVRCIKFFLKFFLLMGDYTIIVFLYQGFCAQSVWIVFFLRRYGIKQEQKWMPFGFDAYALKITKPYQLASWEPSENIFIFSCDALLLQQKIYLLFLFCCKKKTCVVSGRFKSHKIEPLLILFQTASRKERMCAILKVIVAELGVLFIYLDVCLWNIKYTLCWGYVVVQLVRDFVIDD
jgi:hypothetical protein